MNPYTKVPGYPFDWTSSIRRSMKQTIRPSSQEAKLFRDKQASLLNFGFDGQFLLDWDHLAIGSVVKSYFAAGLEKFNE